MTPRAVTLTRLIAVRLLWYAAIGVIAFLALSLHTQFSVVVVLSAIAIYIPLSMLCLPLMAWLCIGRVTPSAGPGLPPVWPAWLAGALGMALLASYHVLADPVLAEYGFLLLLVGVDLALARREVGLFIQAQFIRA